MKKFNLRKKILALTLTAITMFSTVTGLLPGGVVHAADATSGTYFGIDWTMDANGNLTLKGGTCTTINTHGKKWNNTTVKTVKCDGEIICNNNFFLSLFKDNTNLVSADLSGFNTSNVTHMVNTFFGCSSLTSLDLSSFDTSNVMKMSSMFYNCSSLTSLDLSDFNTSNVTNMSCMFYGCSSLISLNISNFNTNNVTDIRSMFSGCSSLTSLDLSNFNTNNVNMAGGTLNSCKNLEVLTTPKTVGATDITLPFTLYDDSNNAHNKLVSNNIVLYKHMTSSTGTYYGIKWRLDTEGNLTLKGGTCTDVQTQGTKWSNIDVKTVKCDGEIICNNNLCIRLFQNNTNLVSANLSGFNTSNVTVMYGMFSGCNKLTSLDLSNFDTSNVKCMTYMFSGCSSLTSLDLSNFDTSKVTDMSGMFLGCEKLQSLNISSFNTSNTISLQSMFKNCSSLELLDFSNFDTSNVTNMDQMFDSCSSLKSLDLSSFNTKNVKTMVFMFRGCSSLKSLNLSSFNTSNTISLQSMFKNCSSLELLDLSSFNTSNVTNMDSMFAGCSSLKSLDLSNFDMSACSAKYFINAATFLETLKTPKVKPRDSVALPYRMYDNEKKKYYNTLDVENVTLQRVPTYPREETVRHTLDFHDDLFNGRMQLNGTPDDIFADDEDFLKSTSVFRLQDEISDNYGNHEYNNLDYVATEQGKEFLLSSLKPYATEDQLKDLEQSIVVIDESDIKIDYITEIIDENGSVIQALPEGKCYIQVTIDYNGVEYKAFVGFNDPEVYNLLPNNIESTTTESIKASYNENNNLVVKANQTDTYTSGKKVAKTVDIDTYGVTDQGTTLLITYDGASTEIEKIVNIEGTLLYNDGTPVQRKVVKLSTPKDMFDLSSDEGHYEFLNVSLTNSTMPLSVFDTDDTSACSNDILLTSGVITFDNTGLPLLDNDPSKEMTLVIEKVTPTIPEREEVVIPTPEVVPTPNPSNTATVVVPEPITDNINSVVPKPITDIANQVVPNQVVNNTNSVNLPNVVATTPGKNIQSDVTKIGNTVNKNILGEKSKQNDKKITDFSKNSDKDNKKIDANNKKPSEEKDTTTNSIKENKSSQKDADMIMGISFLLVLIIVAIIVTVIRSKSKKEP